MAHHSEPLTHKCKNCSEEKPYPVDFIMSFKKMKMTNECKQCRRDRRMRYSKTLGKTDKKLEWKNSISKFFKSDFKKKKRED